MFGSLAAIYAAVETGSWISLICRQLLALVFLIYIDDGLIVEQGLLPEIIELGGTVYRSV